MRIHRRSSKGRKASDTLVRSIKAALLIVAMGGSQVVLGVEDAVCPIILQRLFHNRLLSAKELF